MPLNKFSGEKMSLSAIIIAQRWWRGREISAFLPIDCTNSVIDRKLNYKVKFKATSLFFSHADILLQSIVADAISECASCHWFCCLLKSRARVPLAAAFDVVCSDRFLLLFFFFCVFFSALQDGASICVCGIMRPQCMLGWRDAE